MAAAAAVFIVVFAHADAHATVNVVGGHLPGVSSLLPPQLPGTELRLPGDLVTDLLW